MVEEESEQEKRFIHNLKKEWKQNSTYILLIICLVLFYYRGIEGCNNHYQELLFNDTFLLDRLEYNSQFIDVGGYKMYSPDTPELPKDLNTSFLNMPIEEVNS